MPKKVKFNFSGYVTKNNLKCTDGRVIKPDAFKHQDGMIVPLVWQHGHDSPDNVLGHAYLENRADGVYGYASFNKTAQGQKAQELVEHKDITNLSIYANQLIQKGANVVHGMIKEVSLVIAGANPGATIDNIVLAHADGQTQTLEDEAVIYTDSRVSYSEVEYEVLEHADGEKTVEEVFNTLDDEQKKVVYAMLAQVSGEGSEEMQQSDNDNENIQHSDEGGDEMKNNVFEGKDKYEKGKALTHAQVREVIDTAIKCGSMKESILQHAGTYGIDNLDVLFPDAKAVMNSPEFDKRRTEWVSIVLSGINKTPFARVKSMYADITAEEARAKGYITGNEKVEEVFPLFKRTTDPTTVYKKQKLDRDDIIDITDLDVVAWLKAEMRMMLDEELARAYLLGDGRAVDHNDKIDETKIRPVYKDADVYTIKKQLVPTATGLDELEDVIKALDDYKGSGNPYFFTTRAKMTEWRLLKDENAQYRFKSIEEVASFIGVRKIVDVEVMEGMSRTVDTTDYDLIGIALNLRDYTSGANKGGKVSMFDDFDIDFNQQKYLIETRCSGAMTKIKSAVVIEKEVAAG